MNLLAFETSTEACSVAVWIDGAVLERFQIAPRRHAELALPWAEQLLAGAGIARAQIDAIAVGRGPGAFTGVRLAIAVTQGIALALDRPVVPVSTLAALACRAPRKVDGSAPHILAAIDARMGEVYAAAFRWDGQDLCALSAETVGAPDAVALPDLASNAAWDGDGDTQLIDGWQGVGTGFSAADGALPRHLGTRLRRFDATALPHAVDVAHLAARAFNRGEAISADRLEPAYLRNNVALTLVQQQAARAAR